MIYYINESFFDRFKKKKKEDSSNKTTTKNNINNKPHKIYKSKYGLITKEEYNKCVEICKKACKQSPLIDKLQDTTAYSSDDSYKDPYEGYYENYIDGTENNPADYDEDVTSTIFIYGAIDYSSHLDFLKNEFGKDRVEQWYDLYSDEICPELHKVEEYAKREFKKVFGDNITVGIYGEEWEADGFNIYSHKPKEK